MLPVLQVWKIEPALPLHQLDIQGMAQCNGNRPGCSSLWQLVWRGGQLVLSREIFRKIFLACAVPFCIPRADCTTNG